MPTETLKYTLLLRRHLNLLSALRAIDVAVRFDAHDDCALQAHIPENQMKLTHACPAQHATIPCLFVRGLCIHCYNTEANHKAAGVSEWIALSDHQPAIGEEVLVRNVNYREGRAHFASRCEPEGVFDYVGRSHEMYSHMTHFARVPK